MFLLDGSSSLRENSLKNIVCYAELIEKLNLTEPSAFFLAEKTYNSD